MPSTIFSMLSWFSHVVWAGAGGYKTPGCIVTTGTLVVSPLSMSATLAVCHTVSLDLYLVKNWCSAVWPSVWHTVLCAVLWLGEACCWDQYIAAYSWSTSFSMSFFPMMLIQQVVNGLLHWRCPPFVVQHKHTSTSLHRSTAGTLRWGQHQQGWCVCSSYKREIQYNQSLHPD